MLKRRIKIQKYISNLKKKQNKNNIRNHIVLKHKLEQHGASTNQLVKQQNHPHSNNKNDNNLVIVDQNLHNDENNEQQLQCCWDNQLNDVILGNKNKFQKLSKVQNSHKLGIQQYEQKLSKFYQSKYKQTNWAIGHENIQQKDINDYLNEQMIYDEKKQQKNIKFFAKTSSKHDSIVSGLDWYKNVVFSCGLDHKLKVFHFSPQETNIQLKIKLQKDIFISDLPLSNCYYRDSKLMIGSLRKNFVVVDCQKWQPTFITSSFLKNHKTYENFKTSANGHKSAIFSNNQISILDKNLIYSDSLLCNEKVQDIAFGKGSNFNKLYAVTNDCLYQWDLRMMQASSMHKTFLNYTCVTTSQNSVVLGSKLGVIYFHPSNIGTTSDFKDPLQNSNLTTHITGLQVSHSGQYTVAFSKWKSNAVRFIDTLNGKSIGNWPTTQTKIGLPQCSSFSQQDGYFAIGASSGFINLYGFQQESS